MDITELLAFSVQHKASDLHLSSGVSPMIRVDGDVRRINIPALEQKDVNSLVYDIMNDNQRKDYEQNLEVDFSFEVPIILRVFVLMHSTQTVARLRCFVLSLVMY